MAGVDGFVPPCDRCQSTLPVSESSAYVVPR